MRRRFKIWLAGLLIDLRWLAVKKLMRLHIDFDGYVKLGDRVIFKNCVAKIDMHPFKKGDQIDRVELDTKTGQMRLEGFVE